MAHGFVVSAAALQCDLVLAGVDIEQRLPAQDVMLFFTCTASTLPATSAATGTTKACTRACELCGVRRSAAKYQSRLPKISAITMIAPIRVPFPGFGVTGSTTRAGWSCSASC